MRKNLKASLMVMFLVGLLAGCGGGDEGGFLPDPTDDDAPIVQATIPADTAADVMINRKIVVTFNEPMRASTITAAGTFLVTGPGGFVAGEVTYNVINHMAIFTPVGNLEAGLHTAAISTAAKDVSGNSLVIPMIWSFTVGVSADTTKPEVSFVSPADYATGVPGNTDLNIIFTETMDPETINITNVTLETSSGPIPIAGIVTYDGTVATFNPTIDLLPGIEYIARVTIEVADLAGNTMLFEKEWSFTTN
ncbi:MAG: Ig-like domain-containing protein [Smithellaceae bacterium]